jgi:hypothetical protein
MRLSYLKIGRNNALPAEHPRIDRPRSGPDHRQGCPEDSQENREGGIGRRQESEARLKDGYNSTGNWGPQAGNQQNACYRSDTFWHDRRANRIRSRAGHATIDERSAGEQPLGQKAATGPTVRERREQPLQGRTALRIGVLHRNRNVRYWDPALPLSGDCDPSKYRSSPASKRWLQRECGHSPPVWRECS